MDTADLAIFNRNVGVLTRYTPGTEIRERRILPAKRRAGMVFPVIQYKPIERAAERLAEALSKETKLDWSDFRRSTIAKALAALEDLGFILRKANSIQVQPTGIDFMVHPARRTETPSFKVFIDLLNDDCHRKQTYDELGSRLRNKLGTDWTDGTAKVSAKIMLDWARHSKLAPGVFAESWRKRIG